MKTESAERQSPSAGSLRVSLLFLLLIASAHLTLRDRKP